MQCQSQLYMARW